MKKWVAACLCVLALFSARETVHFSAERAARVSGTLIAADESDRYDAKTIEAAMDAVKRRFRREYRGTLLTLVYDEEKNSAEAPLWAARYGADEAVVLYGDVRTKDGAARTGRQWVLVRSGGGRWKLKTEGPG